MFKATNNDKEAAYERVASLLEKILKSGEWESKNPDDDVSAEHLAEVLEDIIDICRNGY